MVFISGEISEALTFLRGQQCSLVLLDINVQGEAAFSIADLLVRTDVPFGFVTGYDRTAIPARFARIACWRKPIDHQSMVRDIETIWGIR